jgi:hypothetical protein
MQALRPAIESRLLDVSDSSSTRDRNVQVMNFFSERVAIQSQQLGCLNLIAPGFLQGLRDEGTFNGRDQHGVEIAS